MKILGVEVTGLKDQLKPGDLTAQEMAEFAEYNPNIETLIEEIRKKQEENTSGQKEFSFIG